MTANAHNISALADRLANLSEVYKGDVAVVMEDAKSAEVDTAALRRYVSWSGKDAVKRAEQEAIDHQYRFLAGEVDEPATLPAEGLLCQAIRLYADKLTVRQVAKVLEVSVGKAQQLKTLAVAFAGSVHVHVHVNVNTAREMTADDLGEWLPAHDAETGELPREMDDADLGDYLMLVSIEEDRIQGAEIAYEDARGSRPMVADDLGDPLLITNPFRARVKAIASSVRVSQSPLGPVLSSAPPDDDTLEFPPGFDRRGVSA